MNPHRLLIFLLLSFLSVSGCSHPKSITIRPTLRFQTSNYVIVETSPNTFVVLSRSKASLDEINQRLGCGKEHICAGDWTGEMWTIERLN